MTSIKALQETVAKAKAGTTILLNDGTCNELCNLQGKDQEPEQWTWQNNI